MVLEEEKIIETENLNKDMDKVPENTNKNVIEVVESILIEEQSGNIGILPDGSSLLTDDNSILESDNSTLQIDQIDDNLLAKFTSNRESEKKTNDIVFKTGM